MLSADDSGRLLWDCVDIVQSRRRTTCTEHVSKKIRPSERLELYIRLIFGKSENSRRLWLFLDAALCLQFEASAYSGAFILTVDNFSFCTYSWSFFACSSSFFAYSWSFFAYSGKVRLIRALTDCEQRSFTVSKEGFSSFLIYLPKTRFLQP